MFRAYSENWTFQTEHKLRFMLSNTTFKQRVFYSHIIRKCPAWLYMPRRPSVNSQIFWAGSACHLRQSSLRLSFTQFSTLLSQKDHQLHCIKSIWMFPIMFDQSSAILIITVFNQTYLLIAFILYMIQWVGLSCSEGLSPRTFLLKFLNQHIGLCWRKLVENCPQCTCFFTSWVGKIVPGGLRLMGYRTGHYGSG